MSAELNIGPEDVLDFWFGEPPLQPRGKLWWGGGKELDRILEARFGPAVRAALRGELDVWADTPRGRLALIVLLDQFTRNVFRGTAEAFSGDDRALALALEGLSADLDEDLHPLEACFFYMPLEHAESMAHQDRCVARFRRLLERCDHDHRETVAANLRYAEEHRDIIRRFDRFPHRNKVLGRESSEAEKRHLDGGGKSFGQG